MGLLKTLAVLFSLLCVAGAISGIQSVSFTTSGATGSHLNFATLNIAARIWTFALAIVLALFAYGIHIRAKKTWKAGFVLMGLNYIYFVVGATIATYRAAPIKDVPSFWLPIGLVIVLGTAVGVYWGLWWKRQRPYFFPAD
ncbi:MAG TPA: hypothetical protein VG986_14470 [Pseudolabrys sp.]|nr:hypothetical protein [Pseudolabrys sp.]